MADFSAEGPCHILSLDSGGAKRFYTLGVLNGAEDSVGPLHECLNLILGTSIGAIIAALIGTGYPVDGVHALIKDDVFKVTAAAMQLNWPSYVLRSKHVGPATLPNSARTDTPNFSAVD